MDPSLLLVALDVALVLGAAARLTRLAVVDSIGYPLRYGLFRAALAVGPRTASWADELVNCPHCMGFWVSLAVLASWAWWGDTLVWRFVAATLAVSYVVGHLTARLDVEEEA